MYSGERVSRKPGLGRDRKSSFEAFEKLLGRSGREARKNWFNCTIALSKRLDLGHSVEISVLKRRDTKKGEELSESCALVIFMYDVKEKKPAWHCSRKTFFFIILLSFSLSLPLTFSIISIFVSLLPSFPFSTGLRDSLSIYFGCLLDMQAQQGGEKVRGRERPNVCVIMGVRCFSHSLQSILQWAFVGATIRNLIIRWQWELPLQCWML